MPGWFSDHFRNMRRYDHMACAGSVVGTRSQRPVKPGLPRSRHAARLRAGRRRPAAAGLGLELIGRIYLAAGAQRVMPTTFSYLPIDDRGRASTEIGRQVATTPTSRSTARTLRAATRSAATPPRASSTRTSASAARTASTSATRASSRRDHRQPAAHGDGARRLRGGADRLARNRADRESRNSSGATQPLE